MSNQLSNAGTSGLLGMLNVAPVAPGQPASGVGDSALPFGSVMQAQTAGAYPSQVDANGQPLPQTGEGLPPSGEMLAQMQARLAAEGRAPELSELTGEPPNRDLLGPVLGEAESLHEGVVIKDQWLGLTPHNSEFDVQAPEVVALMQDIMTEQSAQLTPEILQTRSDALIESGTGNTPVDVSIVSLEAAANNMAANAGTEAAVNNMAANAGTEAAVNNMAANAGTEAAVNNMAANAGTEAAVNNMAANAGTEVAVNNMAANAGTEVALNNMAANAGTDAVVNEEVANRALSSTSDVVTSLSGKGPETQNVEGLVGQSTLSVSALSETVIDRQNTSTETQSSSFSVLSEAVAGASSQSQTPEHAQHPSMESPNVVPVALVATEQMPRSTTVSKSSTVGDNGPASPSMMNADNKGLTGTGATVTQLVSPTINAAGVSGSPPPAASVDGAAMTGDMRLTSGESADLLRAERASGEGTQGGGDKADSGLRADGRGFSSLLGVATQTTSTADQAAKMTPSQTAFTLAGQGQMGSAPWRNALSERIMVMTAQNNQVAEIQLDPPELGSLKVRLQVGQDQVSVSFVSPHASVRDAVEQSMPRLREMMEQQGLNLGESSVNDQSSGSGEEGRQERFASGNGDDMSAGSEEQVSVASDGEGISLVDYYA